MPNPAKVSTAAAAQVDYIRKEVLSLKNRWDLVRFCVAGQEEVKLQGVKFLPMPNPEDKSDTNKLRYKNYLERAVFYNVTGHTLSGLLGQVFKQDPVVEIPAQMDVMKEDVDGG